MTAQRKERIFADYPDVVTVSQMCAMLGNIGKRTAYELLKSGEIRYIKIGNRLRSPRPALSHTW